MTPTPSPNYAYLAHHDARLVALGTQAEEHFATDPTVTLFKLRQFAEVLAKRAAAKVALLIDPLESQQSLIERLFEKSVIGATQRSLFHDLRRSGNAAVHDGKGDATEALHQLRTRAAVARLIKVGIGSAAMPRRTPKAASPDDLITIAEAAKLLGVSQPTLRRWDEIRKFRARRHPINAYRMYLIDDVLALRRKIVEGEDAA